MEIGKVVAFFDQKKILCAVCLEARDNKLYLLSEEKREITLGLNRIAHITSHTLKTTLPHEELVQRLKTLVERQKELMDTFQLRELWDLVWVEERGFMLRELAELVFPSPPSCDQEMALFRTLADDRLYFKKKGELYEARTPEKVEDVALQLAREAELEKELEEGGAWLAEVWAGKGGPGPAQRQKIVELLKEMALFGAEAPNLAHGKTLLERARIAVPDASLELLIRLGEWGEDENLFLLRHQIPQAFSSQQISEVEALLAEADKGIPLFAEDRDLTFLHPLTIDSEYTRDIDDALSWEAKNSGGRVGIHIADVSTFLENSREIFQEAMARGTSIYLPEQRIPMIPPALSEGICSLVAGEKRRALSFLVHLEPEGRILDFEIVPSVIQVERRLSYDQTDQLLEEGDEELCRLKRMAEKLFQRRLAAGAFFIPRPERVIRVTREREIAIFKRERESPAQKIVSEFMILANYLTALFMKERGIPAIYRGQMEPREKIPSIDKFDPLQAYRLRRIMNRVEVSTQALRHAGLGVEAYLTLSSPIRRFYDLLNEEQILKALRGKAVASQGQLEEIITRVGPVLSKVGLVEELTEQYWIFRHLEKRVGSTTRAVVLDRFPSRYLIHLNEFLLEVDMPAGPGRDFVPGDEILVRVEKVNARAGVLKIAPL